MDKPKSKSSARGKVLLSILSALMVRGKWEEAVSFAEAHQLKGVEVERLAQRLIRAKDYRAAIRLARAKLLSAAVTKSVVGKYLSVPANANLQLSWLESLVKLIDPGRQLSSSWYQDHLRKALATDNHETKLSLRWLLGDRLEELQPDEDSVIMCGRVLLSSHASYENLFYQLAARYPRFADWLMGRIIDQVTYGLGQGSLSHHSTVIPLASLPSITPEMRSQLMIVLAEDGWTLASLRGIGSLSINQSIILAYLDRLLNNRDPNLWRVIDALGPFVEKDLSFFRRVRLLALRQLDQGGFGFILGTKMVSASEFDFVADYLMKDERWQSLREWCMRHRHSPEQTISLPDILESYSKKMDPLGFRRTIKELYDREPNEDEWQKFIEALPPVPKPKEPKKQVKKVKRVRIVRNKK
jgi:hypothetical protein